MNKLEIFGQGEKFHRAANIIIPENWLDDENDDGYWFIPSIVNMAFACELYLKALLADGDNEMRGHNLYELFKNLPEKIRLKITNSVAFYGDDEFMQQLEIHKYIFQDWRYFYEHKSTSVDLIFLERLAVTLHDIAEQRCTI